LLDEGLVDVEEGVAADHLVDAVEVIYLNKLVIKSLKNIKNNKIRNNI
jgi:hypothetical protein